MLKVFPVEAPVSFECVRSELLQLDWPNRSADFCIPGDDDHVLRVTFPDLAIFRVLDEFLLSVEFAEPYEGRVSNHFAYRVEGHPFLDEQSSDWREICGTINHYQFVTGSGCLDVIMAGEPKFLIVPALTLEARYRIESRH